MGVKQISTFIAISKSTQYPCINTMKSYWWHCHDQGRERRQRKKNPYKQAYLVMLLELPFIAMCALNQLIQHGPVSVNTE